MSWSNDMAERLEGARKSLGISLRELSVRSDVSYSTLHKIAAGTAEPGVGKLAAIAETLGVSIDWLVHGGEGGPPAYGSFDWMLRKAGSGVRKSTSAIEVPVFELEVAAGDGRSVLDEEPIGRWPLSIEWVADHVGAEPNLIVVKVRGDSQQPILADGDWLIVDRNQSRLGAGLAVVRVDDILKVKRIELRGRTIALKSANPSWQTEELDREADQDRFRVIGRAVAAIKIL